MILIAKQSLSIFLLFIILFSSPSLNIFSFIKADAQEDIAISIDKACVFNEGESPIDTPDRCFDIQRGQGTFGRDNIFFQASSEERVDTFTCELRKNGVLVTTFEGVPQGGSCKASTDNTAQQTYTNLDDGRYTFTVLATIEDDNNNNNDNVPARTGRSQPFDFIVGVGSGSAGAGMTADQPSAPNLPSNFLLNDNTGILDRLNPLWRTCDATNNDLGTSSTVQNGLSATKYIVNGIVSFRDLNHDLQHFNTNNFVLQIYVNFVNGGLVAEIFPSIEDIPKIKSQADLYRNDPLLIPNENVPRDDDDIPNRIPFGIENVDTNCVYQAPVIATSLETPGVGTTISKGVFENSNPPFRKCTNSEAATYSITFSIRDDDKDIFNLGGYQKVKFIITQQVSSQNPEYFGTLSINPFENNERRISLALSGNNIITECTASLLY